MKRLCYRKNIQKFLKETKWHRKNIATRFRYCYYLFRYYLLVGKSGVSAADVDLRLLRRRCLVGVWCATPAFLALCQVPWYVNMRMNGWPEVAFADMHSWVLFVNLFAVIVVSNLPDFVSVGLYLGMWLHFKVNAAASSSPPPPPVAVVVVEDEEPFGGIWVGEPEVQLDPQKEGKPPTPPLRAWEDAQEESRGVQPQPQQQQQQQQQQVYTDHEVSAVLWVLRLHVVLSVSDLSLAALVYATCRTLGVVSIVTQQLVILWVPLVVVAGSFRRQLGAVREYLTEMAPYISCPCYN